jgi:hypothetical protein
VLPLPSTSKFASVVEEESVVDAVVDAAVDAAVVAAVVDISLTEFSVCV